MEQKKINLLIVDDEEQFSEAMKKRLEVRGFNVLCVNRGDKAIEAARQQTVDIALVDLKMPGISGEETLEALKKEHEWMEVVILTGHGSIDSAVECTRSGAYSYLQKPCELDHLLEVLKDAYKKRVRAFFDLGVFDEQGNHIAYVGPYDLKGKNYAEKEWFRAVQERGVYISDVFLGYRELPHFVIAVKRKRDSCVWYMRTTIDTQFFNDLVESVRVGKTGEAYLHQRGGHLPDTPPLGGA